MRAGVGSAGRVRKVPESSGAAALTGACDCFEHWLVTTLRKKNGPCSHTWHKDSYIYIYIHIHIYTYIYIDILVCIYDTAVGDTTEAYFFENKLDSAHRVS